MTKSLFAKYEKLNYDRLTVFTMVRYTFVLRPTIFHSIVELNMPVNSSALSLRNAHFALYWPFLHSILGRFHKLETSVYFRFRLQIAKQRLQ